MFLKQTFDCFSIIDVILISPFDRRSKKDNDAIGAENKKFRYQFTYTRCEEYKFKDSRHR